MNEFGRQFCSLVAGTTAGAVVGPAVASNSTSLLAYATAIAASALVATGLYRSNWLREV